MKKQKEPKRDIWAKLRKRRVGSGSTLVTCASASTDWTLTSKNDSIPSLPEIFIQPARPKKPFGKRFAAFLFSEMGLVTIVTFYIIFGGLMFHGIEYPIEKKAATEIRNIAREIERIHCIQFPFNPNANRSKLADNIVHVRRMVVEEHDEVVGIPREWAIDEFNKLLDEYQLSIIDAIANGYDGTVHEENNEKYQWSSLSSVLFAASTITTIGYGHATPNTELTRLLCQFYAVIGIPLFSIFAIRVGKGIGRFIRFLYNRVFCRALAEKREETLILNLMGGMGALQEADRKSVPYKWRMLVYTKTVTAPRYDYWTATPGAFFVCLFIVFYVFFGALFFRAFEDDWTVVNAIYCCLITMTTIGLGDYVPGFSGSNTFGGQLLLFVASVYVIVGLATLAMGIDIITESVVKLITKFDEDFYGQNSEEENANKENEDPALALKNL